MQDRLQQAFNDIMAEGGANLAAHARVRLSIERAIVSGVVPGTALPPERTLTALFAVSRITIRRALAELAAAGRIIQRQGSGSYVADRIVKNFAAISSFTEDLRARGLDARSKFLSRELTAPTPAEAMALALSAGDMVIRLVRVRMADERPLAFETSTVPASILPRPELVTDSLYAALDRIGCRPVRALQHLRAVNFDAATAQRLCVAEGMAGLQIERRAFLADGRAVEFTRSLYRGDAYDFAAELKG